MLIDFLRGDEATEALVTGWLADGEDLATTAVNAAELHRGVQAAARPRDLAADLAELLSRLTVLPLDAAAARRYGGVAAALDRGGRTMPALDALIAAIALENGGRLATRNRRHFERVAGLQIVP